MSTSHQHCVGGEGGVIRFEQNSISVLPFMAKIAVAACLYTVAACFIHSFCMFICSCCMFKVRVVCAA